MTQDPIAELLSSDQAAALGVQAVVIEDSLDGREVELVRALGLGKRTVLVCDRNTHSALGQRVERALARDFDVRCLVLDAPIPDDHNAGIIESGLESEVDFLIAVGSGTVNDLVKYVSAQRAVPYVVFATAPSMNGYTSVTASITIDGHKTSVKVRPPRAAFFDLGVLSAAPARLIRAGVGDSVCRPTAQTDWLLSHLILGTPYNPEPFAILATDEAELFARAGGLIAGDAAAMRSLTRVLVLSGFGMTLAGGSHPASQAEHLISHFAENLFDKPDEPPLHGEKVGVATLAIAEVQSRILAASAPPLLTPTRVGPADFNAMFGSLGDHYWNNFEPKVLSEAQTDSINQRLAREWGAYRQKLLAAARPADELRTVLVACGAHESHTQLGWSEEEFHRALSQARFIRDRYTCLDFAAMIGVSVLPGSAVPSSPT